MEIFWHKEEIIFEYEFQHIMEPVIEEIVSDKNQQVGTINIIFGSDDYVLEMNRKFLNHDYYTDILTFDYSENPYISGDLFISIDRVAENAKEFNVEFVSELNRVIIHGILHLVGLNDKDKNDQIEMTLKEDKYLILWDKIRLEGK